MSKGSSFEREIAADLSKWWTQNMEVVRDDIFYRTDGSGSRFTSRKKKGKDTAYQGGDITFSDPIGELLIKNWNIELKTGYGTKSKIKDENGKLIKKITERWDVLDLLDSKQREPTLIRMWKQCENDAKLTNREPILIFRRNNRKPCIMLTHNYKMFLCDCFGDYNSNTISFSIWYKQYYEILTLSNFFNWIPDIRLALKK